MSLAILRATAVLLAVFLTACGSGGDEHFYATRPAAIENDFSDAAAYLADSPYAHDLGRCVDADSTATTCTFSVLPLLGQDNAYPTVDDIMERVVVSHVWMGERFRILLESHLPADLLPLMRSVTAVVIDDDIRPSYYYGLTGAIYLDPDYFWLSVEEKDTISRKKDARSSFAGELNYRYLWRYVKNGGYAFAYHHLDDDRSRSLEDLVAPLAALLYHELAHANDYFPAGEIAFLSRNQTVWEAAASLEARRTSYHLNRKVPLPSQILKELAEVAYYGAPVPGHLENITAGEVGGEFAPDGANDAYNYASSREDVAMLFEETMMKLNFDIERDIAFTPVPTRSPAACDDYNVSWGKRNRLGDPVVRERARLVADRILGEGHLDGFFDTLAPSTALVEGRGWCENLDPETAPAEEPIAQPLSRSLSPEIDQRRIEKDLKPR